MASIFGGENDVNQEKGERLGYYNITLYNYVVYISDVALFWARRPKLGFPGECNPDETRGWILQSLRGKKASIAELKNF